MLIAGINNSISWACSMSTILDSVGKLRHVDVLFTIKQEAKTSDSHHHHHQVHKQLYNIKIHSCVLKTV